MLKSFNMKWYTFRRIWIFYWVKFWNNEFWNLSPYVRVIRRSNKLTKDINFLTFCWFTKNSKLRNWQRKLIK